MKEYKIGDRIVLEVEGVSKRNHSCKGCFFNETHNFKCANDFLCSCADRADGKNIIFKEVSNGKE